MSSKCSNKQNMGRKRKRMPPKNRHTTKNLFEMKTRDANIQLECSSSKKLQSNDRVDDYVDNTDDYFILFNFSILKSFITPMVILSRMS